MDKTVILPSSVEFILEALENAGYEAYAVGGCIRDSLMGKEPEDWDICTSALPSDTMKVFTDYKIIETGLKHGTVTLLLEKKPYEITTFRTEGGYTDCRHPGSVSFVKSIEEDLSRRDFTVNAMAYSKTKGLVDIFGGRDDLANGLIRCVGDPSKRFSEDALRILRGLRFASRLGFDIEEKTAFHLLRLKLLLKNISAERINVEFTKLLEGINAKKILLAFSAVFEEILPLPYSCNWQTAVEKACCAKDVLTCKSVLLHFLYKDSEMVRLAMRSFKSDNASTAFAVGFSENFDRLDPENLADARKLVRDIGFSLYYEIVFYKQNKRVLGFLNEIKEKNLCCTIGELAINGSHIMKLGLSGKSIGACLDALLCGVIEEKVQNEQQALLEYANKLILAGEIK